MPTTERLQSVNDWLTNLNNVHGWDGIVHEVAANLDEGSNFSRANLRYRKTLADVMNMLNDLYDETGYEKLLDMARDMRRLIEWSDSGQMPIQMDLFEMPPEQ